MLAPTATTPTIAGRTPGQELAQALEKSPDGEVIVDLPISLPTTFPFFAARPRYTVRHLLGDPHPGRDGTPYVIEPVGERTPSQSGTSYTSSPEAAFEPRLAEARLTTLTATVPLPGGLTAHPDLLAAHIDRRVVVRLCTIENEALLHGSQDGVVPGLLGVPGRRAARGRGRLDRDLAWAAGLVEETGGSCDGIVVHPDIYWRLAVGGTLENLNGGGIRVSRTRMIPRGSALLGDFRAVATLIDPADSRLVLRRDPDVIEASHHLGLAVHLPQHLVLLDLGEDG
ncbi:family 3 encapsulin nanocompartment shell protein [Spirillospora sp. CA-294931]|uniref:family 3 encapsulin nanocompartment shell protein n=1 Tax=Spirillospora sp. CA-294931 TaxID=3240042 RepID=UPI003D8AFAD2